MPGDGGLPCPLHAPFAHDPSFPAWFHLAERVCSFLPFFFLQLLCLVNIQHHRVRLFPLLLCLAVLVLGYVSVILYFSDASGILVIILTMYFTAMPLLGSLAALAVWAVLGWLIWTVLRKMRIKR